VLLLDYPLSGSDVKASTAQGSNMKMKYIWYVQFLVEHNFFSTKNKNDMYR